ncbi:Hpt domain-containing protein [Flavobacterium muglaense]|uniref:Hpt domain-containing protein n=1 Tax=Flavobacterium muglaense TaxID=2764716 RepID=A0A923MXG8_9FLAO|nr:Hpt domain-containing protein [Flavobacterium muglaense]MBC5836945.1 Hpt domain-containing protein [Flavobacterium muglaense]MBC5843474.1 Hpt domain-containing protein [Flavobacterium muglaense]
MEQPNLNYINDLSGDNAEFKQKLIAILKRELPEEIDVYNKEYANVNYLLAAQSVHKLKHKISILGLEKSYYIAEEYENNLKENSTDLKAVFENILESMQEFVSDL